MLNRAPIEMLEAGERSGNVVSTGQSLSVVQLDEDIATEFSGHYDQILGILTLNIPGHKPVQFRGFLTNRDLREGRQGRPGESGSNGINGLDGNDGEQGHRGCLGPEGPRGRPGERGPRGQRGPKGTKGSKGEEGDRGKPGELMVFIQAEDPGPIGAGGIWVKV